jgi:hypothetical protein
MEAHVTVNRYSKSRASRERPKPNRGRRHNQAARQRGDRTGVTCAAAKAADRVIARAALRLCPIEHPLGPTLLPAYLHSPSVPAGSTATAQDLRAAVVQPASIQIPRWGREGSRCDRCLDGLWLQIIMPTYYITNSMHVIKGVNGEPISINSLGILL